MSVRWSEMAAVGRIARAHGIRGQVIVNAHTDFPEERFQPGAELFIERDGAVEALTITSVHFHRERPVIGLEGVTTMTEAGALAGRELRVPIDRLPALPPGTFYRHDLVGCRVETPGGELVGTVGDVEGTVDGSRLVVAAPKGELLIPLVSEICTTIDLAGRRIVIEPPAGLLDVNTSSGHRRER
jgi:16S rRNA processing protein RimM